MIFKKVVHVHSLEPGETPGSKLCATFVNIAKQLKIIRYGYGSVDVTSSIYLCSALKAVEMFKLQTLCLNTKQSTYTFRSIQCH